MSGDIVERLRSQHSDVRQGAIYSKQEDPTWDATATAADEIERLRAAGDALAEVVATDHHVNACVDDECDYIAALAAWQEARRER